MTRHFPRLLLAVAAVCLPGLGVVSTTPALASSSHTMVRHVRPVDGAGHLLAGYTVADREAGAQCQAGSDATGDAYRCFTKNYVIDPCWVTAQQTYVDCLPEGWSHRVVRLHVTKGYNNTGFSTTGSRASLPWGVQLVSGTRWGFFQGASGVVGRRRVNYGRGGTSTVLIGGVHRSTALWRIEKARDIGHYVYKPDGAVAVSIAWYGLPSLRG